MAEQKLIPTTTIATSNDTLETIQIYTFYNRNYYDCVFPPAYTDKSDIKECFISNTFGYKNGIIFKEGELLITVENYPSLINFFIDSNGNFNIISDDAAKYSINSNGELEYSFC